VSPAPTADETTAATATDAGEPDPWADVVGQDRAVADLRRSAATPVHAYLFVGPRGSGKRDLARAFAAELLAAGAATPADRARTIRLALADQHPDVLVIERVGAAITADQAREVREQASRSAIEGDRKVLVLDEFHLVQENVGPILLKTIEEPPAGTFFLVLVEDVPPALVTIESRCVRIDLGPVSEATIAGRLVHEGVEPGTAAEAAAAAAGDLRRARVLASDPRLALRRDAWHAAPARLDGAGHAAVRIADELLAMIDDTAGPLELRQVTERQHLEERVARYGERGSGRKALEDRHKRELRRHRADELRFGLAVLARRYRDAAVASERPAPYLDAVGAVRLTAEGLIRNPNERLQLVALLARLPPLPTP
jgi:DNA polymerase III subunit delta'